MRRLILSKSLLLSFMLFAVVQSAWAGLGNAQVVSSPFSNQASLAASSSPYYDLDMSFGLISDTSTVLNLHSEKRGYYEGTRTALTSSPYTVTFDPAADLFAGEKVRFSLNTVSGAYPVTPYQCEFYAEVASDSPGYFIDSEQRMGTRYSNDVTLGDLDGDGDLDAFVANQLGVDRVWLNDGGVFTDTGQSLSYGSTSDVALGDLNGDGDLDAFVISMSTGIVLHNNGSGSFTDSGQNLFSSNANKVALGDLDGDGDLDAFIASSSTYDSVWLNLGNGVFSNSGQTLSDTYNGTNTNTFDVALADLDNDGDLDAVTANYEGYNLIYLNNGAGIFSDVPSVFGFNYSATVALADFSGDGFVDIFFGNYDNSPNEIWLNDGAGSFVDSGQALGNSDSRDSAVGDLDGDGDLDIFVINNNEPEVPWLNDGMGSFYSSTFDFPVSFNRGGDLGDLNGDGTLDVFLADFGDTGNKVWFNLITEPLVTTNTPVTDIMSTSVTASGEVTDARGAAVSDRGILYSDTENFDIVSGTAVADLSGGIGTFSVSLTGLDYGSTYYYRAYATNSVGTEYGAQESFTTNKENQYISFDPLADRIYGETFDLTATATSMLFVSYSSSDETVATISGTTVTCVGVGQTTISASQGGDSAYFAAPKEYQTLTVGKADVTLSSFGATGIAYGRTLGDSTINGLSNNATTNQPVSGSFAFDSPATKPAVADSDTTEYPFTFTPGAPEFYNSASDVLTLKVQKTYPQRTAPAASDIFVGQSLAASTITDTVQNPFDSSVVDGAFLYDNPAITPAITDSDSTLYGYGFVPTDLDNYMTITGSITVTVHQSTPEVTEVSASALEYGQILGDSTITGSVQNPYNTASVDGLFTFANPSAKPVVADSNITPFDYIFIPTDSASFATITGTVTLEVTRATPSVSSETATAIAYGQTLADSTISGIAVNPIDISTVNGTYAFDAASTQPLVADSGLTGYAYTFTPTDTANHFNATGVLTLTVNKADPQNDGITLDPISFGQDLSATNIQGMMSNPYNGDPVSGSVNYWDPSIKPAVSDSNTTLYNCAFTPDDTANYNAVNPIEVTVEVGKATPELTSITASGIEYGQTLGDSTPSGIATNPHDLSTVAGAYAFDMPATKPSVTDSDTTPYGFTFTPSDLDNFNTVTDTTTLSVEAATPSLSSVTATSIVFGQALGDSTVTGIAVNLNDMSTVTGMFAFNLSATQPAVSDSLSTMYDVTFTPDDGVNYLTSPASIMIEVTQATPAVSGLSTDPIVYGQTLGDAAINATVENPYDTSTVGGSFAFDAPTTKPSVTDSDATLYDYTFTPADLSNYITITGTATVTVSKADPELSSVAATGINYLQYLSDSTISGIATNPNDLSTVTGSFSYDVPSTQPTVPDSLTTQYPFTFTPDDTVNYNTVQSTVILEVSPIEPAVTWYTPLSITDGETLSPVELDASCDVAGTFVYTPEAGTVLEVGRHDLAVEFQSMDPNYTDSAAQQYIYVNVAGNPGLEETVHVTVEGAGSFSGDNWENACTGVIAGIARQQERVLIPSSGPDENDLTAAVYVAVKEGTYQEVETIVVPKICFMIGGLAGIESTLDNGIFTTWKERPTILDGQNLYQVVRNNGGIMVGFFIENGIIESDQIQSIQPLTKDEAMKEIERYQQKQTEKNLSLVVNCGAGLFNSGIIHSCAIRNNYGGEYGAGVFNEDGIIYSSEIYNNGGSYMGGGIFNDQGTIINTLIMKNNARIGGGCFNASGSVNFSVIAENVAMAYAGVVMANANLDDDASLKSTKIESDPSVMTNSIIVGNTAIDTNVFHNVLMTNEVNQVTYCCSGDEITGEGNIIGDPLFNNIQTTDPANWDMSLQSNSPCIDAGKLADGIESGYDKDYRYRPLGAGPDIGAFEMDLMPTGSIVSPEADQSVPFNQTTFDFSGTAQDSETEIDKVQYRNNEGPWIDAEGSEAWSFTAVLTEGENLIEVQVIDVASSNDLIDQNITAIGSVTITRLPNEIPTLSLIAPTSDQSVSFSTTSMDFNGTSVDSDGTILEVSYRLNGGDWTVATGSDSWNFTQSLVLGENRIDIRAMDNAVDYGATENSYSAISTILVTRSENVLPTVEITDPTSDQPVPFSTGIFDFMGTSADADGNITGVEYRINGSPWLGLANPENWSISVAMAVGLNTFEVRSIDDSASYGAGQNAVSATDSIRINRLPNAAPTGSIDIPTGNMTVAFNETTFDFSGTAADSDGEITAVDYRVNSGNWMAATGTDSWSFTSALIAGDNVVEVRATDNAFLFGAQANASAIIGSVTITRSANAAPTGSMDTPTGNATVAFNETTFAFSGTAADSDGAVTAIDYRVNGGTWMAATGMETWSFTADLTVGDNVVEARAIDNASAFGGTNTTAIIGSVTITRSANAAPTGLIDMPTGNATVVFNETTFAFSGTAADSDGAVTAIDYRVNSGSWMAAIGMETWSFTADLSVGDNVVEVRATDNGSAFGGTNATTSLGSVTITRSENVAPIATIISPEQPIRQYVSQGTSFTFSGTAADEDGEVARVIYNVEGDTWFEAQGTSDWTFDFTLDQAGFYIIFVRAIDDNDAQSSIAMMAIELVDEPVVDFESNTMSVEEDNEIFFYDLSTGQIESWAWDFDNDGNVDSTDQNATWIYDEPGLYTVTLTVFDGIGEASLTKEEYISVFPTDAPDYDAEVVSYDIPSTMNQFNEYVGTVTVRNTGWVTWLNSHLIYLGTQTKDDGLNLPRYWRVDIPEDVRYGETVTFTVRFTPQNAGTFTTQWQMVFEDQFWFGDEVEEEIQVDRTTAVSSKQWNMYQ